MRTRAGARVSPVKEREARAWSNSSVRRRDGLPAAAAHGGEVAIAEVAVSDPHHRARMVAEWAAHGRCCAARVQAWRPRRGGISLRCSSTSRVSSARRGCLSMRLICSGHRLQLLARGIGWRFSTGTSARSSTSSSSPHRPVTATILKACSGAVSRRQQRELSAHFLALTTHYLLEASFARTGRRKGGASKRVAGEYPLAASGADRRDRTCARSAPRCSRGSMPRRRPSAIKRAYRRRAVQRRAGAHAALPPMPFHAASFHHTEPSAPLPRPVGRRRVLVVDQLGGFRSSVRRRRRGRDRRPRRSRRRVHPRQPFGGRSVDYRHYLPELAKKPQAVQQVADELIRDLRSAVRRASGVSSPTSAVRSQRLHEIFAHVLPTPSSRSTVVTAERVRRALVSGEPVLLALAVDRHPR